MSNSQNQGSRPTSFQNDIFTITISGPAPVTTPAPVPITGQFDEFNVTISGGSPVAAPAPVPITGQFDEFTVTISGGTSSPASSLGGDVTPAARSRGRHASRPALAGGGHAPRPALVRGDRHIVIDWSNISISAMNNFGGRGVPNSNVRINISELTSLLADQRSVGICHVAGSIPSKGKVPSYGAEFQKLGYTAEWLARSGAEKGVDSCLHAVGQQIVLDKLEKSGCTHSTETLVLVTGDGNAHTGLTSFPRLAESAAKAGLFVEIWSWEATLSGEFAIIAKKYPGRVSIHHLDPHQSAVCYIKK